jgi:hypothetical protein
MGVAAKDSCPHVRNDALRTQLLLEGDRLLNEFRCLAEVLNGSLACAGLVVCLLDVVVSFVKQFGRFIQASDPALVRIERG